jgi:hypothetical protein
MALAQTICDLSRRGDISAVTDSLKNFYKNKEENPWHSLYKNIETHWNSDTSGEDLADCLSLIREAVFGALDILSFGLIAEISTPDVLTLLTSETSWLSGRQQVRNLCLDVANELIAKREVRYLLPSALVRDGFSFLVPKIEEAQWQNFTEARPKISRKKLDLTKLESSMLGSRFLRDQGIMETKIDSEDPRTSAILEAYDLQLIELEVDRSTRIERTAPTEQETLNGGIVQDTDDEKEVSLKKQRKKEDVVPLTEFIEDSASSKGSSKRRKAVKK